jgi:hypothetical protein
MEGLVSTTGVPAAGPYLGRKQEGKNAGIAKILLAHADANGCDHAGMGILIDPFHVITCAHVINAALELMPEAQDRPTRSVRVSFPMLGDILVVEASVVRWSAPGTLPQNDIALLRLVSQAPEEAGVAILADITGMPPDGDALSVFGVAAGNRLGQHVDARFKGPTSAAWVQIDGANSTDAFIVGGFSGGAVWDYPHGAVLGMVVARKVSAQQHIAYMIPSFALRQVCPELEVERRSPRATFARTWTAFAALFFVLIFSHWAVNRGAEPLAIATFSGNHKQLAVFYGMHIYAFFAPFLLAMLISFARSFRMHNWFMRVPSFGAFRRQPVSSIKRRTAAASLLAFVLLPLAAQVHFIRIFHTEGYVYIDPKRFGFEISDTVFDTCDREAQRCTKHDAGRYSLAAAKPGRDVPYWDHAYQYGERNGGALRTATFFPILQPLGVIGLTILSSALSLLALFYVFRPLPLQMRRKSAPPKIRSD